MVEKATISLRLPAQYSVSDDNLKTIVAVNSHLNLRKGRGNSLILKGKDFTLPEKRFFALYLHGFSEQLYEQTQKLNQKKHFGLQYAGNLIYLEMGTFGLISALTAIIIGSLVYWNQTARKGRVYTEEGEYKLPNPENAQDKIRVKPDVSFISYEKVSEKQQNVWRNSFINVPPTLVIEIVSSKSSLKETQEKMQNIWMQSGAQIGLVINPYEKKIYIYEKGKKRTKVQSTLKPFMHQILPGYIGDFSAYADEF